jgi:hypothetical protein
MTFTSTRPRLPIRRLSSSDSARPRCECRHGEGRLLRWHEAEVDPALPTKCFKLVAKSGEVIWVEGSREEVDPVICDVEG